MALVGYPDGGGGEPAAVVVARWEPLTTADLRDHPNFSRMTQWYQPSRLELTGELPRTRTEKVQKELLRQWLRWGDQSPRESHPTSGVMSGHGHASV